MLFFLGKVFSMEMDFRSFSENCPLRSLKGGSVEETLVYKFSPYNKFEFSYLRTESQNFVLFFVRKTTEFLTAKHWLSYLPVTQ